MNSSTDKNRGRTPNAYLLVVPRVRLFSPIRSLSCNRRSCAGDPAGERLLLGPCKSKVAQHMYAVLGSRGMA